MGFGAFTHYIDIPQVVLYAFWIFFVGLIFYLRREDKREGYPSEPDRARPTGSPQPPAGDPMLAALGPASYAERADKPEVMFNGEPLIVPMRLAPGFRVATEDCDPRGMEVVGADGQVAGKVSEIWVDRAEPQIRYLEVVLATSRTVLLPITYARIGKRQRRIDVVSILARHFAQVPAIANPDRVTLLEEDRITAYYAGGHLYAEPSRLGPIV